MHRVVNLSQSANEEEGKREEFREMTQKASFLKISRQAFVCFNISLCKEGV